MSAIVAFVISYYFVVSSADWC